MAENDDLVYKANLNIEDILSGLKKVDKSTQDTAQRIDAHFKKAGKSISGLFIDTNGRIREANGRFSAMGNAAAQGFKQAEGGAQASGVKIGVVSGVVQEVTRRFIDLGIQALKAFADIAKESTQIALGFDVLKSRLLGIFDGNKAAADEAFGFIQKKSKELGIDLGEVAGAFLPKVESLEQFERVAKIATALARSDPEQGAIGARIALIEALSGTFTSLQRRFEIPKDDIKAIKEAFDTRGMEGFIEALEDVLSKSGKSFDDLKNTAQASIDRVKIQFEQLQGALGIPIVEELKEQFDTLFAVLEGREDDLLLIADTFGRVAASIVEIIGTGLTDFLTNLDSEQVIEIGETFFDIAQDVKLLADLLVGVEFPSGFIDGVDAAATKLKEVLETTAKIVLLAQANAARTKAETQEAFNQQIETGIPFITSDDQRAKIAAAGQAAHDKVLTEGVAAFQEATQASEENREATDKRREAIDAAKDADSGAADALLGEAAAARDAAEAAEVLAGAQAKVDEATAKIEKDFQQDLLEADIKFERARTDALLDGQRKRQDAAKKNLEAIQDIEKKNRQAISDSGLDLNRDTQDIATKHARESIEQRKDEAQKIIDLETDTRRKIADIIDKSQIDLDEAADKRDAVSYLRILKQRNLDITAAQQDASRTIQDTQLEGQRKREELKLQQEQEIADAQLANSRRLEDLKTNLARELEAQATNFDREREQIATNEQRKLDDIATARERDREDAQRHYEEKLADLQVSLAEELAIIAAGNAAIEAEAKRHADEMAAIAARERASAPVRDTGRPSSRPGAQNIQQQYAAQPASRPGAVNQGRQFGGLVNAGQTYNVHPPELFTPSSNGKIIPGNQLIMPSMTPKSAINNVTNNNQKSANLGGLLDANSLDTLLASKVQNILLQMLDRMG